MIKKEASIFLVVGSLAVLIDYLSYQSLLHFTDHKSLAKAVGFIAGTVFAYIANRLWTFGHVKSSATIGNISRFISVYSVNLVLNVIVNAMILNLTNHILFSFLVATGVSATSNFFGMKFFVFKPSNTIGATS